MRSRIVRMCDSGIFERSIRNLPYDDLFAIYEQARADYGVMKDVLWDSKQTLASARHALRQYRKRPRAFKLVLVAQGKSVDEYLSCFSELVRMGAEYIAVGGLLRKREASVRYMYVSSELAAQVLAAIRKEFGTRWLFVLGAYHHSRHQLFSAYDVFGSDYKGWIFNYEHRRDHVAKLHEEVVSIEKSTVCNARLPWLSEQRDRLSRREGRQRLLYIEMKNDGGSNSLQKAQLRQKLLRTQDELSRVDAELIARRQHLVSRDGLPSTYKDAVKRLAESLHLSDQEVRVRGVHEYLRREVYSQCLSVPELVGK
ncbi:MAG: hypothetical protein LAO76_02165 [Acidobacteriia bacterium]|nr:hypothetical protein [Terriglobia bacterium]